MWKAVAALLLLFLFAGCGGNKTTTTEAAHGVRLIYEIDPASSPMAPGSADQSLELGLTVLRERLMALGLTEASVLKRDGRIVAELPPIPEDKLAQLRAVFVQRERLEFRMVAPTRPEHQAWARAAELDPSAGVASEADAWSHYDSGEAYQDVFLTAPQRADLERFVAAAAARTEPLAPGLRVVYEQVPGADGAASTWRTYVIDSASGFVPTFTDATVGWDPNTNQPHVNARLDERGKRAFAELTSANVGRKLAMIRGDRVLSAPIIQSPIAGGAVWITMGGSDPSKAQGEAEDLVVSLRATGLSMPLVLARIEHF